LDAPTTVLLDLLRRLEREDVDGMVCGEAVAELPGIFGGEGSLDERMGEAADIDAGRRQSGDHGSARKHHETFSLDMLVGFLWLGRLNVAGGAVHDRRHRQAGARRPK
ncbi:hypothetical protein, partial [Bradyrhizobium sp.]|uniref:hypothetical protein n=1 Tax=Bradyrhizobium sp. TaxID=376 RepID=UPI0025BDBEDB